MLANRKAPPDAILQEVYRRTGDKPFKNIDDVISREELIALSESYKRVAGYDKERLKAAAQVPKMLTTTKGEARVHPASPLFRGRPRSISPASMTEPCGSTSSLERI